MYIPVSRDRRRTKRVQISSSVGGHVIISVIRAIVVSTVQVMLTADLAIQSKHRDERGIHSIYTNFAYIAIRN
jgi:hypothetical protein